MKKIILLFFLFFVPFLVFGESYSNVDLKRISHIQIKANKLQRRDSVIIQINDRAGDYAATILIPYSKGDNVRIEYAYIQDIQGNIVRWLKKVRRRTAVIYQIYLYTKMIL